jgi:tetratricopeptide (TPR) repeat protein
MSKNALDITDYNDPICPFCTDQYQNTPPIHPIPVSRVLEKLDEHLGRNDYATAEKHLLYWLGEAEDGRDRRGMLTIENELMGLYRKTGRKEPALDSLKKSISLLNELDLNNNIIAGTTYTNAATVYKAFSMPEESYELFQKAKVLYEQLLEPNDSRLGGLYNNLGLTLTDLKRYDEATEYYNKAIDIMYQNKNGELEVAISYLNLANLVEAQLGAEESEQQVDEYIEKAYELLNRDYLPRDGYHAFVCEKCAPTFGYYGRFIYEKALSDRAREIYERN